MICVYKCVYKCVCKCVCVNWGLLRNIHNQYFCWPHKTSVNLPIFQHLYVLSFVFQTYTPLSTFYVFIIVPFIIWSYIKLTFIVAIQLKSICAKYIISLYNPMLNCLIEDNNIFRPFCKKREKSNKSANGLWPGGNRNTAWFRRMWKLRFIKSYWKSNLLPHPECKKICYPFEGNWRIPMRGFTLHLSPFLTPLML